MNSDSGEKLAAGINYILEGRQTAPEGTKISRHHILVYADGRIDAAMRQIEEWERRGDLKILRNLREALDEEYCVGVYRFIGQNSPIKGWLNWK